MRRPAVLAAAVGLVALVVKRRGKSQQAERELWKVATDPAPAAPPAPEGPS